MRFGSIGPTSPMQRATSFSLGLCNSLSARAKHDGQSTRIDVKPLDQRLGFTIRFGIEPLTRMAVAAQKALEPKHITVPWATDDHRPASSRLEEPDPTQYQRAHDPLAQLRLCDEQCPQLVRRDDQRLYRRPGVGSTRFLEGAEILGCFWTVRKLGSADRAAFRGPYFQYAILRRCRNVGAS